MNGIPGDVMRPLKETLRRCDVFESNRDLQNVFIDQRLYLWRDDLHDTDSTPKRVENLVSILVERYRRSESDSENALLIFLQVLTERYKQDDDRYERLNALANTLKWCLNPPTPLATNHITSQANPQAKQMLLTDNLEKMLECARSVARVELQLYRNKTKAATEPWTGTGWLIAPGIVATCWHMVTGQIPGQEAPMDNEDLQLQIQNMLFTFDYLSAGRGIPYKIAELLFPLHDDQSSITDYAILRLKDREDFLLSRYRPLPLELDAQLTSQSLLYIIQHPLGGHQRIAYDTYERESSWPGRIHYHTPTEKGTSGAPILNPLNWHVIGLHNGEDQEANLREGTLIKSLLKDLHDKRPEIWQEIAAHHHILLSTDPSPQPGTDGQTQEATLLSTQEILTLTTAQSQPGDSSALNGSSIDTSSAVDQSTSQPKGNTKPQPFDVLKGYQEDFAAELKSLSVAQKLFAPPDLTRENRQRRAYPDEGKDLLKELDPLEKLMRKYAAFFKQIEAIPLSRSQKSLEKIGHFQSLIKKLRSSLVSFCASNREASYEEQIYFHQQLEDIHKIGKNIEKDSKQILNELGKSSSENGIQSMEGQEP